MRIIVDKSDGEETGEAVLAVNRGAGGQPLQRNARHAGWMEVERLLNVQPQADRKVVGTRRPKKDVGAKKAPTKPNLNLAEDAPKYEFLPELATASCGFIFCQLLRGDTVEAKRETDRIFSGKGK